jgi:AAA family ATP:ADP antiporter
MWRAVHVRAEERPALAWSFLYFFCLLCGYYVLRPVRDEMGVAAGVSNLPWLFTGTFAAMLAAVPLFGWVTARFPRRAMLPAVYLFFVVHLLAFFLLTKNAVAPAAVAAAFFVWVSVFNLFVVSVFWSFMVDLFTEEQAKRLFGAIAAGGSAGALAGPAFTAALAVPLGVPNLLLVSAALLGFAVLCIGRLNAWSARQAGSAGAPGARGEAIGGSVWGGVSAVLSSRYLLALCLYIALFSLLFTFLYFEQARIVSASLFDPAERTRLFALLDLAVNALALALQIGLTARLLARLGVAGALAVLPALAIAGFAVLGAAPTLAVLLAFQVVRRAAEYAIAKPARELLFAVLDRERKYKAKNFIDTVVFRAADAASGWLLAAVGAAGLGAAATAAAAVPLAAAWLVLSWALGRRQEALARGGERG